MVLQLKMNLEYFKILRELLSLSQKIDDLNFNKKDELERIQRLKTLINDHENQSKEIKIDLNTLNQEYLNKESILAKLQQQIEQHKKNEKNLVTQQELDSYQLQLVKIDEQKNELEESLFLILENIESKEKAMFECNDFLLGAKESLLEISNDVKEKIKLIEGEIIDYEKRIILLQSEIPTHFKKAFEKTKKMKLKKSSMSFIQNGQCSYCAYKVNSIDETSIETKLEIHHCQSCQRLILPYAINTN